MKKLVLVFMVLASFSAIADQAFMGEHSDKEAVCSPCEAAKEARLKQERESGKDVSSSGKDVKASGKQSGSKQ